MGHQRALFLLVAVALAATAAAATASLGNAAVVRFVPAPLMSQLSLTVSAWLSVVMTVIAFWQTLRGAESQSSKQLREALAELKRQMAELQNKLFHSQPDQDRQVLPPPPAPGPPAPPAPPGPTSSLAASMGLSQSAAHRQLLSPVTNIINAPRVSTALQTCPATPAATTAAVAAVAAHLQDNPAQLTAFLAMPVISCTKLFAGSGWCSSAAAGFTTKASNAVALALVALRIPTVRQALVAELVPAHTHPRLSQAAAPAAQWAELNRRLFTNTTWKQADHVKHGKIRDVMWSALGDDVAHAQFYSKTERVAAALFVGLLAREGMVVAGV